MTITHAIGYGSNKIIRLIVRGLALSRIHPNVLTFLGLVINIAAAYLLVIFHQEYVGSSVRTILQDVYLRPLAAGIFANLSILALHGAVPSLSSWQPVRYLIPVKIAIDFAIFAPVYVLILVALRQVTAIDWNNFLSLIAFGFEFLRHPLRERVKIYR